MKIILGKLSYLSLFSPILYVIYFFQTNGKWRRIFP